jgi:1-acyl-sn-glycerol-3-phosphate acyltransferase
MISLGILTRAVASTLRISIPTVIDGWRGTVDPRVCDARLDSWSKALLRQAKLQFEVSGVEHIDREQSYVIMSNHQSLYDIPVLYQAIPLPIRMAGKAELFKTPIWGGALHAAGFVELDRSKGTKAYRALLAARDRLQRDGTSLWIAPEGTRSLDGELLDFKHGGFHFALIAGLPILPVTMDGTIEIHRQGSKRVYRDRTARVVVHEPVDPNRYGRKKIDQLVEVVKATIAERHPKASTNAA